jgi:hypothetical protein
MKQEIIYTDDYALIVSDEGIKDVRPFMGKYHLEKGFIINQFPDYFTDLSECKLIIAHRPLTDEHILKGVPLLPEFEDDDFLNTEIQVVGDNKTMSVSNFLKKYGKETYKYTENDLRKAMEASRDIRYVTYSEDEIIQSIQQPKLPQFFDCKEQKDCPYDFTSRCTMDRCDCKTKLKTTTNSQGQTELVGDYIYE